MAETKTQRTETKETTVSQDGPNGTSRESHSERTTVDEDGKKTTTTEDHHAPGEKGEEPAEVDASMPPGGTYS